MPFYFYKFFWPLAYSTHQAVQPLGSTALLPIYAFSLPWRYLHLFQPMRCQCFPSHANAWVYRKYCIKPFYAELELEDAVRCCIFAKSGKSGKYRIHSGAVGSDTGRAPVAIVFNDLSDTSVIVQIGIRQK